MAEAAKGAAPPAWDIAAMQGLRCDVVNAALADGQVLLHVGQREQREDASVGVQRLQTLVLTPYSAKRLQELLAYLVSQHDQRRGDPA
jgi:hypothetical protein